MRKPSARLVVAALAIPVFGGFATYAAAQVSSTPSPQVVIPAVRTSSTKTPSSANTASRVPGHDVNDDKGGLRNDSLRTATGSTPASTPNTVDDHGNDALKGTGVANPAGTTPASTPNTIDDHGNDAVTGSSVPTTGGSTPASTPNTVDDHGGRNRGQGGSGHGS
ncbi:MAG: hypothetical protein JWM72_3748 [Actinomycetia bacterium]|nr:hypothetical protein [Actinomycetes bacterium]